MHRLPYKTAALTILLVLALAGTTPAQQQHQHPSSAQPSQKQPAETAQGAPTSPQMVGHMQGMMEHMQGMMEHMQGMMEQMQGMMGDRSRMSRRGPMGMRSQAEEHEEGGPQRRMKGRRAMMGHGDMIQHHLERLAQQLELTPEQRTQMWAVLGQHAKEAIRLKADLGIVGLDLRQLQEADPVDLPQVKQLLQTMAGKEADLRLLHITAMQDMSKLLTPEQRQKLRTMQRHMREHGGMLGRSDMMGR
jgi:Spy/CpxP family protein refolding chaperone